MRVLAAGAARAFSACPPVPGVASTTEGQRTGSWSAVIAGVDHASRRVVDAAPAPHRPSGPSAPAVVSYWNDPLALLLLAVVCLVLGAILARARQARQRKARRWRAGKP